MVALLYGHLIFKSHSRWGGEMALSLRALATLTENLGLVPNTHRKNFNGL